MSHLTQSYDLNEDLNAINVKRNDVYVVNHIVEDVLFLIKENEYYRDELHMISVNNARLFDCLAMADADV